MHLLTRLLGALLVSAVVLSVGAWVLDQTLWNADYMKRQMHAANLAGAVASAIPQAAGGATELTLSNQERLSAFITPSLIQGQLDRLVPALIDYYHNGGLAPQLDLRVIATDLADANVPLPDATTAWLSRPESLANPKLDPTLQSVATHGNQARWLGPLAVLVLAALIFVLAGHRRWLALAENAVVSALCLALLAAVVYLPPRLIASNLATSAAKPLAEPFRHFAELIARDQAHLFLVSAAVLAGIAVLLVVIHFVERARHHLGGHGHSGSGSHGGPTNRTSGPATLSGH